MSKKLGGDCATNRMAYYTDLFGGDVTLVE
jgi:hypothetical protein